MIAPAPYDRMREHFLHACSLATEARRKYLEELTLTDDERDALAKLLAADSAIDGATEEWLARPAIDTAAIPPETTPPPSRIGPYQLHEPLGEGGMGIVFRAEQKTPVVREVAIKVMKRGFDPGPIVARFEAERQALANLNHPGITQILDAGVCPTGEPYFVMERVEGTPITDHCRDRALSVVERLELFVRVCAAVQHAHTKGIIHRDLKPSNILVTMSDDISVPKIIDFGIAKGVEGSPESVALTLEGMMIGTPAYMSPEQAAGSSDLDTRTDVYSLGVVLYELLTGTLPFDPTAWREASFAEIARVIQEEAPPRPSSRTENAPAGTALEPSRRALRGDLDWIILKALEKEPARRYESPARLADDIVRHLRDEPVLAGPPSTRYVVGKYLRRHKSGAALGVATLGALLTGLATGFGGPVVAAVTVLALLLAGILSTSALLRRARFAREAEAQQRELADRQRAQSEENRRLAAQHLDEVLRLSDRQRLGDLESRAESLWPASPALIPAFESWLEEARRLAARLDDHRRFLGELREQAVSSESKDATSHKWRFSTPELQWWHDCASELVSGLERFTDPHRTVGTLASVETRLESARTITERTIDGATARAAWHAAIEDIATLPVYRGLTLSPQLGLLPLGKNPDSGLWEFWHVESGECPAEPAAARSRDTEETGIALILVPGGEGRVGAQKEDPTLPHYDPNAEASEGPVTEISLEPYFIARTPITQGQWLHATGSNPSVYATDRKYGDKQHDLRHPIEHVSWDECQTFLEHLDLEIPTEAQWEFATRAGSETPWWTGSERESLAGAANLADRYARENKAPLAWEFEEWLDDGYTAHAPVGTFLPNRFGLYDVHGNVWEWCRDCLGSYEETARDPATGELIVEPNDRRHFRGGSFMQNSIQARSANRNLSYRTYRASCLGVRPSRPVRAGKVTP